MTTQTITHPELVKALLKPGAEIADQMTAQEADLWHNATGISGEVGEILECIYGATINRTELDVTNLVEELGDLAFYLEGLRQNLGIERDDTLGYVGDREVTLMDEAVLLSIAASHLLDQIKKAVVYKKVIDLGAVMVALASIERSLAAIRGFIGVDRPFVLAQNIEKLSVRYAGLTYSNEAAQARADKAQGE